MKKKSIGVLRLVLVVILAAMLAGCGKDQVPAAQTEQSGETQGGTEPPTQTPTEPSEPEATEPADPTDPEIGGPTAPPVQIAMPEYELTYSGDMADMISWEQLETGLIFYVKLSTDEIPIFTMHLNQTTGDIVEVRQNGAGEDVYLAFLMEPEPEGLSASDSQTFCMAQDIVNDISNSLVLK